jgi:L-alanine-DL-glutamate epimerase-like enolase superfamily enzyme
MFAERRLKKSWHFGSPGENVQLPDKREVFAMKIAPLTFKSIRARVVVLKLKRPVVARIATITDWPLILIDLFTEEGIVGRSYLEPYTIKAMKYLVPALQDFGAMLEGRRVAPVELYDLARKSLHFVGYQGLSMIAVSGMDMAAWDALAKASGVPPGWFGGAGESIQQQRIMASGTADCSSGGDCAARRRRLRCAEVATWPRSPER